MSKKMQTCHEHALLSRIIKLTRWKQPLERFLKCKERKHKYIFHIFAESMCLKRIVFSQMEKTQMKTRKIVWDITSQCLQSLCTIHIISLNSGQSNSCPVCFSLVAVHLKPMTLEILSSNMVKSGGTIFEYSWVDTKPKSLRNAPFLAVTWQPSQQSSLGTSHWHTRAATAFSSQEF